MLRLAAECGMRRGEVAQVHTRDLIRDGARFALLVHGKGERQRVIALPIALGQDLATQPAGYLFPSRRPGSHLTAPYVGKIVSRRLSQGWTMHTLRHFFATVAYARAGDLLGVQQQLGHASPATTQRYIAVPRSAIECLVDHVAGELSA